MTRPPAAAGPSDVPVADEVRYGANNPTKVEDNDTAANGALEPSKTAGWSSKTAPWYVRNSRWLMAGSLIGGIGAFSALGFFAWRALGPSPLDEIKVTSPAGLRLDSVERGPRATA